MSATNFCPAGRNPFPPLTEPEQTAARFLFCALIGYLKEEAPMDEQSFPMVMEMLNYAEGAKEDGDKDVIDILMEETRRPDTSARGIFQRLPPLPAHAGG